MEDTGQFDAQAEDMFEELTNITVKTLEIERENLKKRYRQKQEFYGDLIQELFDKFN